MLVALIGDIHGNLPALQAVLDSIDNAGIQTVLSTGDSVVGFPWPNEVIGLLRERDIPTVQGEMDRLAATFLRKSRQLQDKVSAEEYAALAWTYDNLTSANLEFLAGLPRQRRLTIEGTEIFLCHGTPGGGQVEGLEEDDEDERFLRQREVANTPIVICGRTHRPFGRYASDCFFANPGSVGYPGEHASRATYALLNTEAEPWTAKAQFVDYDFDAVQQRLDQLDLPRP